MALIRDTLAETIVQIVRDKGRILDAVRDDDTLQGSLGLDSLDLAVLVVRAEQQLGFDPFRDGGGLVATFGQLVDRYESSPGSAT